jgi:hypothetical protein
VSYQITATTLASGTNLRKPTRVTTSRPTAKRAFAVVTNFRDRRMTEITIEDADGRTISEDKLKIFAAEER